MLAWVVDPWSTKYENVLGHAPSQHPDLGAMFHQYGKAARVLHHRVFRDKGHRLREDRMLVLQLEHMR